MAGTWICSKNYAFDAGVPLPGAIAQFFMADTLTAMTVYVDYYLTVPAGDSVVANGNGQWPVVYLDETAGSYRYRTIRPDGSVLDDLTTLAIIGPGTGGGGGPPPVTMDATQLAVTGDTKWRPTTTVLNGWVRCNGGSIGSALSTGSEMKADICQALFTFLWNNVLPSACPVLPSRGLNALDDWNANRTIGLPDTRGRALFGTDLMGAASQAGRLTAASAPLGINANGSSGGLDKVTLTTAQMPVHGHAIGQLITVRDGTGTSFINMVQRVVTETFFTESSGGGAAHVTMPPFILGCFFMKL